MTQTWPLSRDRDTVENRELLEVFAPAELSAWREAHGTLRRMVADRCDLVHRMRFRGTVAEPAWRTVLAVLRQVRHAFGLPALPTLDDRLSVVVRPRRRRSSVQSPLETYLCEISETPLLNAEQELELAYRIIDNADSEARDRMVRANLRLVVNIARVYTGKGLALEDLIEEGNLGLLRAVEGFDPTMNTRFSTYASYWIKQSIKRAIINTARAIRIPAYMVELLARWCRASAVLQEEMGRVPTEEEVARSLNLPKRKLGIIKSAIRVYNAVPQTDHADLSLDELLMDSNARSPGMEMIEAEDLRHVLHLLDRLDQREATVLRMRFGLVEEEPKTLKEIGESLGLTRERVRQIESEALGKLSEQT